MTARYRQTSSPWAIADDHDLRSQVVRQLLVDPPRVGSASAGCAPPRVLVQYWNDRKQLPGDVKACLDSWAPLEMQGFRRELFDDDSGAAFIRANLDSRHLEAFKSCQHPAMRADLFRLCFMHTVGGLYVDADDVYLGGSLEVLFADGRLKLHPLCYDIRSNSMVNPFDAVRANPSNDRIFYVNNNPLVAPPKHRVIAQALDRATASLLSVDKDNRDVQGLTGPGNLTACLVAHAIHLAQADDPQDFQLLTDWDSIATSRWPLGYRSDERNWRLWAARDGQDS